jgi:protection of telomeres protein 1
VYSASKIPRPPSSAVSALINEGDKFEPSEEINRYVPRLCHDVNKDSIMPSETEFQQRASASLNIKPKLCLLSDVNDGKFCDLVVRVCRDPYDHGDKVTLYVSDYTENPSFFNFSWENIRDLVSRRAGDPYGYTGAQNGAAEDSGKPVWVGPLGKRAIQITAFEPHAGYVREHVTAGTWISLRNVQIKYGHDNQNLEGKLRGDLDFPNKINVSLVDIEADADGVDQRAREAARVKEAVRRWRQDDAETKAQLKQLKAAETAGVKRKAAMPTEGMDESFSKNSSEGEAKTKAQLKRARRKAAQRGETALQRQQHFNAQVAPSNTNHEGDISTQTRQIEVQLNPHVKCENHSSVPTSSIATIIAPSYHLASINSEQVDIRLPFINAKYKSYVRVVDFHPPSLTQFAVGRNKPKYGDILLSDDDNSSDDESAAPDLDATWEWRFSLQLEDAAPSPSPQRVWVVVDNAEGQQLTGLDAADLRHDIDTLSNLHDRMAILWGNLGEIKDKAAAKKERNGGVAPPGGLRAPPPDSSDSEDEEPALANMPFACYIKQYGVPFQRGVEAGAQPAQRWTRVFALTGTQIQR